MKTYNNNRNENSNAANIMAKVINYAAELLKQGASVETMSKYGHIFYDIRKGNEYVCLCTSDFVKAAEIANGENNTQSESETTTANANESKKESRPARVWATICARFATLWAILKDYAAGTWDSIQNRTAKAARKVVKMATRAALYLFRFVWFAAIFCATLGTLYALASAAADVLPHFWPLRLVAFFVIAAAAVGVELLLIAGTRRIDNATENRLFNMY